MASIGTYGYFVAGVFFVFLLLLLITTGLKTVNAKILFGVILASACWSVHVAVSIFYNIPIYLTFLSELIKNSLWGLLCISLLTKSENIPGLFKFDHKLSWFYLVPLVAAVIDLSFIFQLLNNMMWLSFAQLIQAIALLIMVEFLYRQGSADFRWGFKPIAIIISAIAMVDFILYSTTVLLQNIDLNLFYIRGLLHLLLAPVLLIGIKRFKSLGVRIFVSREVVFHSTLLVGISLYLTLMAATGYYLNFVGGTWSIYAQLSFAALALFILALLFINETIRRKIRVFISKHFFANRYDYRQQWISLNNCLASPPSDNFYHTALFALTKLFEIEQGVLFKLNKSICHHATINCTVELTPWIDFLAHYHLRPTQWIIDLDEYERYPDTYPDRFDFIKPLIGQPLKIIIPIFNRGEIYGYFILSRPGHKALLNYEDRDLLITASQQLANYLALNEASIALSEVKQFDAFNQMSAFLVHDLKNIAGQLCLLSANSVKHKDNPEFIDDAFETVDNAANKINKMLAQLSHKQSIDTNDCSIAIKPLLIDVSLNYALKTTQLIDSEDITLYLDRDKLVNILDHLIRNSQQATGKNGKVDLHLKRSDSNCIISIIDNGCGMTREFIKTRLFKPFDTTKGNAGMGIGAYEAKHFIEGLGGEIIVTSTVNKGTSISLAIPMSASTR